MHLVANILGASEEEITDNFIARMAPEVRAVFQGYAAFREAREAM